MSFETEKKKKWLKDERVPYCMGELKNLTGADIKIVLELDKFPDDTKKLDNFNSYGLTALRNHFRIVANDSDFKEYVGKKIGTIVITCNDTLNDASYEYNAGSTTLKITATSKDQHWVGNPVEFIKNKI